MSSKQQPPAKPGSSRQPASAKQRREQAAAARAAQQAAEARRDRMIKIIGGLAVLVVVVGIIAIGWIGSRSGSTDANPTSTSTLPSPDPNAKVPKGVVSTGDNAFGVPVGTPKTGAPTLQVWEDFQCPACNAVEQANGQGITALGTSGAAALFYRPTAFLDTNLASANAKNGNPDSSHRAIAAWGCAIDAGKTVEYHKLVYANQPSEEGVGYSQQQLLDFGKQAGITGAAYTTFEKCVTDKTYLPWAVNATATMQASGVNGTPTAFINGQKIDNAVLADKAKLDAAIAGATAK